MGTYPRETDGLITVRAAAAAAGLCGECLQAAASEGKTVRFLISAVINHLLCLVIGDCVQKDKKMTNITK